MEDSKKSSCSKISSEAIDMCIGKLLCFGGGIIVLIVGIYKLITTELTDTEAFFAMMLVLISMLSLVILGMLIEIAGVMKASKKD